MTNKSHQAKKNNHPKSIFRAFIYACQGLQQCWRTEASFRLEVVLGVAAWLGLVALTNIIVLSVLEFLLLTILVLAIWVVELLNSAVEAVVDRTGSEHHPLSAYAKDAGAAAVLITVVATAIAWLVVILPKLFVYFV